MRSFITAFFFICNYSFQHVTDFFSFQFNPPLSITCTQEIGNLTFDKDDQLAVEFVTAAANIRASSFGILLHSLFEAKGIAGNIVHAVATTNAIIAGLIVIEAIKVLQNDANSYRCGPILLPIS